MEKLIDLASAALAGRLETKHERRAWNDMIRRAKAKGALLEDEQTKQSYMNNKMQDPKVVKSEEPAPVVESSIENPEDGKVDINDDGGEPPFYEEPVIK